MNPSSYFNTRRAATDIGSGRMLAPGEAVDAADLELGYDVDTDQPLHDQRLVDDGTLADATPEEPEQHELTGDALAAEAQRLDIAGRSSMSADELRDAVAEAQVAEQQGDAETPDQEA